MDKIAKKTTNLLEEIMVIAKKHGYTVCDFMVNNPRIEIGIKKDSPAKS